MRQQFSTTCYHMCSGVYYLQCSPKLVLTILQTFKTSQPKLGYSDVTNNQYNSESLLSITFEFSQNVSA